MSRFIVEGTIGCGKTSTLEALRNLKPEWLVLEEPVWDWENYNPSEGVHENLLKNWYEDPNERTFRILQLQVLQTLLERYTYAEKAAAPVTVFERSMLVSDQVFLEHNFDICRVPEIYQLQSLCRWGYEQFEKGIPKIYLKCSEETMVQRVVKRGRPAERQLQLLQLQSIQKRMDRWAEASSLHVVDTSTMPPSAVAAAVVEWRETL